MPTQGQIKFIESGSSKLRYQYAAITFAVGLVIVLLCFRYETKEYLTAAKAAQRSEHGFTRLWFDGAGTPVGATEKGQRLTIHLWSGENWQVDLGAPIEKTKWVVAPDSSQIAWISSSTLYLEPRQQGSKLRMIPLPAAKQAWALTWLSDHSVAVLFNDADVQQFDSTTGAMLGEKHLSFTNPEQGAARLDYIALGSVRSRNIVTYSYRPGAEWEVVERSPAPDFDFQLLVPGPGVAAGISEAGVHHGGMTLNTPGPVYSAAVHLESFLITGQDFEKVQVLDPDGERYPLTDAQPGSLVAADENQVAVSGPDGTHLFMLGSESRLTSRGRSVVELGFLLIAAALLICFGPFIISKLMEWFSTILRSKGKKAADANLPREFEQPPPELIRTFQNGEGVVWAGAGLSAQSGLPLREAFITGMIQTARVEESVPSPALKKIEALAAKGDSEQAMDLLVTSGIPRSDLIAHYRAVYYKFVARSRSHDAISRMPLAAVITTNYDGLLDASDDAWTKWILTLASFAPVELDAPFLLKLYGDLPSPPTALLSRFEFAATFPHSGVARLVRRALEEQTLLFVGASLSGLITDLAVVGPPRQLSSNTLKRQHFATVGVSGSKWREQAAILHQQYGIQVIPCSEESVSSALPNFLASLAAEIEKRSTGKTPSVLAADSTT